MAPLILPIFGEPLSWGCGLVFLLVFYRYLGILGLYAFVCCAVIISNIQVYKVIDTPFGDDPLGMGTALMTLTFIATDFITETKDKKSAQRAVALSFLGYLMFVVVLWITVKTPLAELVTPYHQMTNSALKTLFLPAPGIFVASLIAYGTSQYLDITLFAHLKQKWASRNLVLRTALTSCVATFVDNFIFSILAWIVFHPQPLSFEVVWKTFILGGYVMRIFLSFFNAPIIALLRRMKPTAHAVSAL